MRPGAQRDDTGLSARELTTVREDSEPMRRCRAPISDEKWRLVSGRHLPHDCMIDYYNFRLWNVESRSSSPAVLFASRRARAKDHAQIAADAFGTQIEEVDRGSRYGALCDGRGHLRQPRDERDRAAEVGRKRLWRGCEATLAHKIVLDTTPKQAAHCRRACDTKRYAYNRGLGEWQHMHKAGDKPTITVIKRRFNAHRKAELPWTYEVESFDLWVDQFDLDWDRVVISTSKDHTIAGGVLDCGSHEFRRQLQYKAAMRGGRGCRSAFPVVQDLLGVRLRQSTGSAGRRCLDMHRMWCCSRT
jgi:hypothetical protein